MGNEVIKKKSEEQMRETKRAALEGTAIWDEVLPTWKHKQKRKELRLVWQAHANQIQVNLSVSW
jgi:hypothetical protein